MINPEYRTKELLKDIIEVMTILNEKGMERVRPVFHTSSTSQFKPMFIVGYDTPKHKDKYIMFTSKFYEDEAGKKTGRYSSIRMVGFAAKEAYTEKVSIDDIKAMTLQELEDRPYSPKPSVSKPVAPKSVSASKPVTVIDPDEDSED